MARNKIFALGCGIGGIDLLKRNDNNPSNLSGAKMSNIREEITAKIIAALEKDLLPCAGRGQAATRASTPTPSRRNPIAA